MHVDRACNNVHARARRRYLQGRRPASALLSRSFGERRQGTFGGTAPVHAAEHTATNRSIDRRRAAVSGPHAGRAGSWDRRTAWLLGARAGQ